jgi:Flp pilus assembly protein TadD
MLAYSGDAERTIDWAERALRLSPVDRLAYATPHAIAIAQFSRGRYAEAVGAARRAVEVNPSFSVAHAVLTAALAKAGQRSEAEAAGERVLALQPSFSAERLCAAIGIVPALAKDLTDAWREAGLPA